MGKIIVLDELTASQIAAGEVIERPASVVKETVENSIDAGATSVTVEIRSGGIKYIRVTDNGSGFDADDAVIAFDKHATSKIRTGEDLTGVKTLGFRGEALASIAAVADVELLSRTADEEQGIYVHIRGGDLVDNSRRGSPKGTVLTVKDLFYNVPARYKFLKKDQTEAGYVADTLEKLALANPEISFKLISNGQEILRTPGNGLESAVYSIFGKECVKDLLPVSYTDGENKVSGFTGVRGNIFGTRSRQFFFVNGRSIKSSIISSAVDEAYRTVTMKHQFPMCILAVEVPSSRIDVNVHPAKTEVRFASERGVFSAVMNAVKNALLSENRTVFEAPKPEYKVPEGVSSVEKPVEKSGNMWKSPVESSENKPVALNIVDAAPVSNSTGNEKADNRPDNGREEKRNERIAPVESRENPYKPEKTPVFQQAESKVEEEKTGPYENNGFETGTFNDTDVYTNSRIIGQYLKTYILLEYNGELAISHMMPSANVRPKPLTGPMRRCL